METTQTKQGKVIGNVGTLDIRTATEESVARIRRIGNVGMVIYSPETAHLMARLNIGNMGNAVQVPDNARLLTGQVDITREYFKNQAEPLSLAVVGQLLIRPDVEADDIRQGLDKLAVCGQVLCPETLAGVVQSKLVDITGAMRVYGRSTRFAAGKVTLDAGYVEGLEDGTELLIVGNADVPAVLDDALLKRKLARLEIHGKLECREENLATLRGVLSDNADTRVSAIPAGFEPLEHQVALDASALGSLPARKLYCTGSVEIAADVDAADLDEALDALQVRGLLLCPASLKETVARKCDLLKTKAAFYEGELWQIDDHTTLVPSRFDFLEGKATLVVRDVLDIDPAIEPRVLAERLARVHNLDVIRCTPEQMGALQARMGLNEGQLVDVTKPPKEDGEEEEGIGNAGTLRL